MSRVRIALIHATPVAMQPIREAFASGWPEAEPINILDDSLAADGAKAPGVSAALCERFGALVRYARDCGAQGVLFTCSAFGPAIDRAAREVSIPVLKPNEAMFEAAFAAGSRIGMVATFAPAVDPMQAEFEEASVDLDPRPQLTTVLAAGALDALRRGDTETHDRLVAECASRLPQCDAVMLAQFSTARALRAVRRVIETPVLTSPDAAVAKLRALVEPG